MNFLFFLFFNKKKVKVYKKEVDRDLGKVG